MAKRVYPWPDCLGDSSTYDPGEQTAAERGVFDGAVLGETEVPPRARVTIAGEAVRSTVDRLAIFLSRLAGGQQLAGLWDLERLRFGWDNVPAFGAAGGEFWTAGGRTAAYAGEPANPPTGPWRSVEAAAAGAASAGATGIDVDGLLAGDEFPAGTLAQIGFYRYVLRSDVVADGTGAATLPLAHPLRGDVADNAVVRIPGDFGVFALDREQSSAGPTDGRGVTPFSLSFIEIHESEVSGGVSYVID